jgi:hypothetical protein
MHREGNTHIIHIYCIYIYIYKIHAQNHGVMRGARKKRERERGIFYREGRDYF